MRKRMKEKFEINEFDIPDLKDRIKNSYEFKNRKIVGDTPKAKRYNFFNSSWAPATLSFALVIFVCAISLISVTIKENRLNNYRTDMSLNYVSSRSNLRDIVSYNNHSKNTFSLDGLFFSKGYAEAPEIDASPVENNYSEKEYSISETNKQVENVDESDIVKCDGKRIYRASDNCVLVNDVDSGNLGASKKIMLGDENGYYFSSELYLTKRYLVVLFFGSSDYYYYSYYMNTLNVNVYDINTLELVKTYKSKASYLCTSRMIEKDDPVLYLVFFQRLESDGNSYKVPNEEIDNQEVEHSYNDICYYNSLRNNSYTMLVSIKLGENIEINSKVQLSDNRWSALYMNENSIYLASVLDYYTRKNFVSFNFEGMDGYNAVSIIVKYSIKDDEIEPIGSIITSGTIISQFAMDEYNGYFRVALSNMNMNKVEVYEQVKEDNGYSFKLVGKVDQGLGELNEVIKSVTFNKDICLVVTAKNTDPMYKIDLSDPTNPTILGKFKEDGYNSYLQYLKGDLSGYAIGIGYMTEDISDYYNVIKGSKFGLYDVKGDNPVQLNLIEYNNYRIEACSNHKALFIYMNYVGFGIDTHYVLYRIDKVSDEENETAVVTTVLEYEIDGSTRVYYVDGYFYLASSRKLVSFDSSFEKLEEKEDTQDYNKYYNYVD